METIKENKELKQLTPLPVTRMGAVTNLFYHARQEHTISAIFPNVRKTLPYKEHVTPATSKLSPGGAGGQIQKRACPFTISPPIGKALCSQQLPFEQIVC